MLFTLFFRLFGLKVPKWCTPFLQRSSDVVAILVLLYGVYHWIEKSGERKGASTVEAAATKAHAKTVEESKADTTKAQTTANAIDKQVTADNAKTTTFVAEKTTEIHNALDKAPTIPADSPTPLVVFDDSGVQDSINSLVERANRSADTADAQR